MWCFVIIDNALIGRLLICATLMSFFFMFFSSNSLLFTQPGFKMPTATDAFLYTTALLLFIIHLLSPYLTVILLDYYDASSEVEKAVLIRPIFSGNPDKRSDIRRNVFDDQMKYMPPALDKQVVILSEKNFDHFIAKNRYVMVAFYASWSPACWQLAPEYAEAAMELKGEVVLAKVDADREKGLLKKYEVQRYPTLYLFVGGVDVYHYNLARKRDAIVKWTKTKMALGVYPLTTTEQLKQVLMAESTIALALLDSLQGLKIKELAAAAKLHPDVIFYQTTSANVAKRFHTKPEIRCPALILLEKESKHLILFNGPFTRSDIAYFIFVYKIPPVTHFTMENAPKQSFGKNSMQNKFSSQPLTISDTEFVLAIRTVIN